jgi:hypothetical protein
MAMYPDEGTPDVLNETTREVEASARRVASEARQAGEAVRSEVSGVAGDVRDEVMRQAEAGRERAADRLKSLAGHMRSSTDELRGQEAWLADLVDKGAKELSHLADTLQRRDLGSLIGSLEDFARRQPALYAGAAVALGFAAARLAKSRASRGPEPATTDASAYSGHYGGPEPATTPSGATPYAGHYGLHEDAPMGGGFAPSAAAGAREEGMP